MAWGNPHSLDVKGDAQGEGQVHLDNREQLLVRVTLGRSLANVLPLSLHKTLGLSCKISLCIVGLSHMDIPWC